MGDVQHSYIDAKGNVQTLKEQGVYRCSKGELWQYVGWMQMNNLVNQNVCCDVTFLPHPLKYIGDLKMNYEEYTVRVYGSENREWYQNGKLHRTDGPAVELSGGTKKWYQNGKRHRTDGPAIEWADGTKEWYLEGENLSEEDFHARMKDSCAGKVVEIEGKRYRLEEI